MFNRLSIETSSYCNRRCSTCLRQIQPDRESIKPWFTQNLLPTEVVYGILDQAHAMGFRERICFNFYNEPMLDRRLPDFGKYAKKLGFSLVMFASNGDYLDEAMAKRLDGCFDSFNVSPYENNTEARHIMTRSWFKKTRVRFTNGLHFRVHCFSGEDDELKALVDRRCPNVSRNAVVNHRGDFLACCQEIVPHFNLGSIYEASLKELWERKNSLIKKLIHTGGRRNYPYCSTCLRGSIKDYVPVVAKAPELVNIDV